MLPLNVTISYYKRPEIRKAMAEACSDKEVGVKYGLDKFGKRPDVIIYDSDVLAHAQKKVTSFHISEESWSDPMQLAPAMRRAELDNLRIGWDLVIDIDFEHWEATLVITDAIVQALLKEVPEEYVTVKFSGNKGFHIAVPFEAFPDTYVDDAGKELIVSDMFPEAPKLMVQYLMDQVDGPENGFWLSEKLVSDFDLPSDVLVSICEGCGAKAPAAMIEGNEFVCSHCDSRDKSNNEFLICSKCSNWMERIDHSSAMKCDCGSVKFRKKVDLGIDTLLVSSRHMYRLVYSLHEKSGLASIPVKLNEVLSFNKKNAEPDNVKVEIPFINRNVTTSGASDFFTKAMKFLPEVEEKNFEEIEWLGDAAPEAIFPPTITKMLAGMEDGRKRALFVLTNFLRCVGWSYEMIEARLDQWNKDNPEPLREQEIKGHLRYHKQKGQMVLPPNFDNDMYYKDLGVLLHDELSQRLKNPVQYVRLKNKQTKKPEVKKEEKSDESSS